MEEIIKTIDIEKAIKSGNNKFLKSLPGFVVRFIKKVIYEDEINATINRSSHLTGVPFINDIIDGWNVKVIVKGAENLPASGRFIFASNHPVGGMDALAFFNATSRYFPDMVSPANQLLQQIPNLRPLILGLNVFGKNTKETAKKLDELYDSGIQVFIFPSGEVSRRKKGVISDPVWQKSFITKAIQHKRDIIPVHISGRNSSLFYNVASIRTFLGIKMYVETMLLPREMMKQRKSTMTVSFGKPIPYQTFTSEMTHQEWAQKVKSIVYSLPE
jgi:putative hemolysin